MRTCHLCGTPFGEPINTSSTAESVTALAKVLPIRTVVDFCRSCGHLQTPPLEDVDRYYDEEYAFLTSSEEEDDLYDVVEDRPIYRTEYQVRTLLRKVEIPEGALVLDYGCGKGAAMRLLEKERPDVMAHLFDVSRLYESFWSRFCDPMRWAVYEPDPAWAGRFDLVTSFFVLGSVAEPVPMMRSIHRLLKPNGLFYAVLNHPLRHPANLIVADQVNHFTVPSLRRLLAETGFELVDLDEESHRKAFVLVARRTERAERVEPDSAEIAAVERAAQTLATYWKRYGEAVRAFEATHAETGEAAIYGAGFYGTHLSVCLRNFEAVRCFVDRNPFRQGTTHRDRPVVSPEALPESVRIVYVGLDPFTAREAIRALSAWEGRRLHFFYPPTDGLESLPTIQGTENS